ncbi:MAG: nucleotidyltransferase substrate binding protein [Fimbriimonadia bacterium]|nr:nucleotidyltransferase substrate binding protein [Fimbriimonadia bacterium]
MIDYTKVKSALKHLEAQLENYRSSKDRPELTEIDREAIAESTIQRFETAYDVLWKTLKRFLTDELGVVDIRNSPKPIIREAHSNDLLKGRVNEWLEYADARTSTAHDHSYPKAEQTLAIIPNFLDDAIGLYQTMTGETWE